MNYTVNVHNVKCAGCTKSNSSQSCKKHSYSTLQGDEHRKKIQINSKKDDQFDVVLNRIDSSNDHDKTLNMFHSLESYILTERR